MMALTLTLKKKKVKKKSILSLTHGLHQGALKTSGTEEQIQINGNGRSNGHPRIDMNADLADLCKHGQLKDALGILSLMDNEGIRVHTSTYNSLLQGCLEKSSVSVCKLVHAHMIQTRFKTNISLGNKLVSLYAKCGSLADGRRAMNEMPERNVVSWTAMIAAYKRNGCSDTALALFYEMQATGIQPNQFTFASVLPACASLGALEIGKDIHEEIIRCGFEANLFVGSALVDMYVKCGRMEDARYVFDRLPERRSVVSTTAMIAGYAQNGYTDEALRLFWEMPEPDGESWTTVITALSRSGRHEEALILFYRMQLAGIEPDQFTVATVLPACANIVSLEHGKEVHEYIIRSGFQSDVFVGSALVDMYVKCGKIENARQVFDKMPQRNLVSWNAMIAGYARSGYFDESLKLFEEIKLTSLKPDLDTFVGIILVCANLAALQQGKVVHEEIIRSGLQSDVFLGSALVDMYAKCGSIQEAVKVFDKIPRRDVVLWTAMILGYAMHGYGKEAVQLFEEMQTSGTIPDEVTFIGVLSACCHAGLVNDGWQYFNNMSQLYHITPTMDHYCCMVDVLGRAGHLDEAIDFINRMPVKPEAAVWRSLLGACKIYTKVELGEHVAEHLFELEPENAAHYVLLSNLYAQAGRWDGIRNVRKLMKDRRVKKKPGCSWIEVNKKAYAFVGGDRSHPQTESIYAMLETLSGKIKEAGYVADTSFMLHDVEEEQKEYGLFHHSEKLALAFGVINIPPGIPIRIAKNLRVCGDCHSAIKFISKTVAREIFVRDASRFHHFKDELIICDNFCNIDLAILLKWELCSMIF